MVVGNLLRRNKIDYKAIIKEVRLISGGIRLITLLHESGITTQWNEETVLVCFSVIVDE